MQTLSVCYEWNYLQWHDAVVIVFRVRNTDVFLCLVLGETMIEIMPKFKLYKKNQLRALDTHVLKIRLEHKTQQKLIYTEKLPNVTV